MDAHSLRSAVLAGLTYFAVVFAAGFALGTLRVLVLVPRLGEDASVLLELPVMLTLSWMASRRLVALFGVSPAVGARLLMGGLAFAMLMTAELGISVFGFRRTFAEHVATYQQIPALFGLAAQIIFAALPAIQLVFGQDKRLGKRSHFAS